MLDKIYILIALVVGIIVTIFMLIGDYTAKEWAYTTFWCIVAYLFVGMIVRRYLKKNVFVNKNNDDIIGENQENHENPEDLKNFENDFNED
ncbi:MAG: hypothetical protein ACK5LV_06385 [Lachnospirales bacterium]